MTEQTFRSPNFYEREIDLSVAGVSTPTGVPAGVIATSNKGPAFVPISVGNFNEFKTVFGDLDSKKFGPYAANEWLKHRSALTFMRVLGAGANKTDAQILLTETTGRVTNAGFVLEGTPAADDDMGRHTGVVQFLCARHEITANESFIPMLTDNDSIVEGSNANLVRGLIMTPSTARIMVLDGDEASSGKFISTGPNDDATVASGRVKIVISSSLGDTFARIDGLTGIKILTASLDPTSDDYFGKLLNRDPDKFVTEQHLLYADFPVDEEIAIATQVSIMSGSAATSDSSAETSSTFRKLFGAYDSRYTTPASPWFISQPFGAKEHKLFKIEAFDDGEYANKLYKITISNILASNNDVDPYGTFTVNIRDWNDTDTNQSILESFPNCSLNPKSENYIAARIGDRKVKFNFDATTESERRLVASGKYPNRSQLVRVVVADDVDRGLVPAQSLPFGFTGLEVLKTNDSLTDAPDTTPRLGGIIADGVAQALSGSIVPPIPFRYKVTRGEAPVSPAFMGAPSSTEVASQQYTWGVKFERNVTPRNANVSSEQNGLVASLTKFMGIKKLDVLVTGSGADDLNNNKFTLARVALPASAITDLTGSASKHMREAAYVRNGKPDASDASVIDALWPGKRITLGTLLTRGTATQFNKFSPFAKFTTFMAGGYDGVNFLDRDARRLNDKATSFESAAGAGASYTSPGFATNQAGIAQNNSSVHSYKTAIDIMTDPTVVNHDVLVIPGIREPFITDHTNNRIRDYGLAFYVKDISSYDDAGARLYDDSTEKPNVDRTVTSFNSRVIDNSFSAAYFPDVFIDDVQNKRIVKVPASVAVMGALAFNDRVQYPWFAPAGFNRASLDFVKNVTVRLNSGDRDKLYDARINPIATFPRQGFVIYGQKTLQLAKSSLDRVNVRRMLLVVKRVVIAEAKALVFENSSAAERAKFVSNVNQKLAIIQAQAGIETYRTIMNETNNTPEDEELNRVNGRVIVLPTKTIEFISLEFVVSRAGISFA